jgi:hypothetical protein
VNTWIDWGALGKIVGLGLLCGAGLPALFAVGLRALSIGAPVAASDGAATSAETTVRRRPAAMLFAGLCFAVVLTAIAWGIYLIVSGV